MSDDDVNSNPFLGLFSTMSDALSFSSENQITANPKNNVSRKPTQPRRTNEFSCGNACASKVSKVETDRRRQRRRRNMSLVEDIFGLTLDTYDDRDMAEQLVFIDAGTLEEAVFERVMLSNPKSKLITSGNKLLCDSHTIQTQAVPYLYECYCRLQRYRKDVKSEDTFRDIQRIILRNVGTALQEPALFENQKIHEQYVALFLDLTSITPELLSFTNGIVSELTPGNDGDAENVIFIAFSPLLDIIHKEIVQSNLLVFRQYWFVVLHLFASNEHLAKLLIVKSTPKSNEGRAYSDTLLGALLNLSGLPKTADAPFDFFDKPLQQSSAAVEGNIWIALNSLSESLQKLFHLLLKCTSEVRHLTLEWFGNCLHANMQRGKLWNAHSEMFGTADGTSCASDGFMLNLGNVLLRLSQPFYIQENDSKALKIDPTYCAAQAENENESRFRGLHMKGMTTETCLIPTPEGETRPTADSFGFITECFFLTHKALDLGYRIVFEKFMRTNQDLARIQRVYNDAQGGGNSEVLDVITQRMEMEMTKYLSLRASLLVPEMLNLLAKFHATTAFWMMQVNVHEIDASDREACDYSPKQLKPITFPLPEPVPLTLRCIPEFIVENTVGFLCILRRLNLNTFEEQGSSFLNPILTEVIALMESQNRLYNPHLRARLAEGLETLLPTTDDGNTSFRTRTASLGTFHRQQLFTDHPHRKQIVPNLLNVFVSIEMTGQSVQFEQKFNYRRPMYVVMEYLWKLPEHRDIFILLSREAEANMEAVQPPLFLRFINLLTNDAVFLLDEALANMAQLRQMLQARENGEWDKLPPNERGQQAGYLQHVGMIARFDNILGRETINTLKMLTTEIKSIFCHITMVDRIASMLNYLLLQLVGPNKKNLKVKDQKEYDFNPANLVLNICEIYINLSKSDSFVLAVSQDGRSYSPELFKLAESVLVRIGGVGILGDLDNFAKRVKEAADEKKEEDEIFMDIPDEFLDPIMSTLMRDPVVLPSSKITIDRQTIARHLLSDQTDPFNRSPLTMDMIKSDTSLKAKIQQWMCERKERSKNNSQDVL